MPNNRKLKRYNSFIEISNMQLSQAKPNTRAFQFKDMIIISTLEEVDNMGWLPEGKYKHTTISNKVRPPSWEEILQIKQFIHQDKLTIQVIDDLDNKFFHLWEYDK